MVGVILVGEDVGGAVMGEGLGVCCSDIAGRL